MENLDFSDCEHFANRHKKEGLHITIKYTKSNDYAPKRCSRFPYPIPTSARLGVEFRKGKKRSIIKEIRENTICQVNM